MFGIGSPGKTRSQKNVALYVDGPNLLRKELSTDLNALRETVKKYGRLVTAKVFLNQFTPQKMIEAVANQGWEPVVVMAGAAREEKSDVDAMMGASIMEGVLDAKVDVIVVATRDADFTPVVLKAKAYGKETVVIGAEPSFSVALRNAADHVETLNGAEMA
ncbi:MAG: NYN domain-containing protein [Candidatus Aenigmatarchaeota archaeon]|nr:MAG: NYN domain-containing protein [Candidatus Aenigmarchaeota archaeon]